MDAATSLEHLAKACLAKRSPALLTELKNEANFWSLLVLLGIPGGKPPRQLRTVGLRDALARARAFVPSQAPEADLQMLVDLRDGTVHAGHDDEVEERLVVAFARQADAFLADLRRDRTAFWAAQLGMVDALLAEATDKTARVVAVKIAGARAEFGRGYGGGPPEVLDLVRRLAASARPDAEEERMQCPACASAGFGIGDHEVDWDYERDDEGHFHATIGKVWFNVTGFECTICGLDFHDEAEVAAAGMEVRWLVPGADPNDYDPGFDEDLLYEGWRESGEWR